MVTERVFTVQELQDLGLPGRFNREKVRVLSDEITDQRRWTTNHELIFQLPDQPEDQAWMVHYQDGSTEYQDDTDPWYDEATVTATLMVLRPVTEMKWIAASGSDQ